jgi:hypothetical protein
MTILAMERQLLGGCLSLKPIVPRERQEAWFESTRAAWHRSHKTSRRKSPVKGGHVDTEQVDGLMIGYARVSTDAQDLTAQRDALTALRVAPCVSTSTTA